MTALDAPIAPPTAPPAPPPAATRLDALLAHLDRAFAWLDALIARYLPHHLNPLAHAGAAANFALTVAVISGVALLVWYSPSLTFAHSSLASLTPYSLGAWVRALHRYSSDLALLFILLHATRVFVARKFSGARWLPWLSGIALLALVWFIGWTGYWLVWDQPAQQIAVTSMRLLDGLPIFGEPLGRLYVADRTVPSLFFFVVFFTHMLLPLGIAVGLALHLTRVSRARLFPNRPVALALTFGLALAALLVPAPLDAPAAMAVKAPAFTVDAWYLTPLALALRLQSAGLWLTLLLSLGLASAIPWLLGRRRAPAAYQALVEESRCHACTQCTQDCPFDAITMVPRTDAKKFPSRALVDPAKCVGCGVCAGSCDSEGISLPWFDTRREESRLFTEIASALPATPLVAFIAADLDGPLAFAHAHRWRDRLPGYQVHLVPTASWLRPKFLERLLATGTRGVLIVRDARAEAAARDGNRWVALRLSGERPPIFRPERANHSRSILIVDHDPARPSTLITAASAFRATFTPPSASAEPTRARQFLPRLITATALAAILALATIVPSRLRVANPTPTHPEFVFSFKALGDRIITSATTAGPTPTTVDTSKPIHMRGPIPVEKPHRSDVLVRVTIDGVTHERVFRAKGISRDGPALDEIRLPLTPGPHALTVWLQTGPAAPPQTTTATLEAQPRRLHVLTYDPSTGFRFE